MHDGAIGRNAYDCFRSADAESGARIAMEVTMLLAISRPRPVFFSIAACTCSVQKISLTLIENASLATLTLCRKQRC